MIGAMAGSSTPHSPSAGWDALRAADWAAARAVFESELANKETAASLDGLARARWWLSDIPGGSRPGSAPTPLTVELVGTNLRRMWPSSCPVSTPKAWGMTPWRTAGWPGPGTF